MYFRADIRDVRLRRTVCDIMGICDWTESAGENFVLAVCDENSAGEYAGLCPCIVLYRDEKFTHGSEYKRLRESDVTAFLKVPFMLERLISLVSEYAPPAIAPVGEPEKNDGGGTPALTVDFEARLIECGGRSAVLTERELALLEYMLARVGSVVSRAELMQNVWKSESGSNIVDVYVSYLRRKLDTILPPGSLVSVRGEGYVLRV